MSLFKKLLIGIVLLIIIVVIIFFLTIERRYRTINRISDGSHTIGVQHLSQNHKITTLHNNEIIQTVYYKNGTEKIIFADGSIFWDNGYNAYMIINDEKLPKVPLGNSALLSVIEDDSFISTGENSRIIFNPLQERIGRQIGSSIRTKTMDGRDYYVLSTGGNWGSTTWIDRETFLIRKIESNNTENPLIIEFIVETGVVSEEQVSLPNI